MRPPPSKRGDLPLDLELQRLLKEAKRVHVLHFGLGTQRSVRAGPHRDVGVAAQTALFHVAVVHAERHDRLADALEAFSRVGGRSKIGLGHDFDEGHAGTVEVEISRPIGIRESVME